MQNDIAYANTDFIPNAEQYFEVWEDDARAYRELEHTVGRARLNLPYGAHEREKLDVFYPAGRPTGVVVFVHGGYWRRFDRRTWSHFAQGLTARGWAVAIPSYPLAPDARISAITQSIRAAVESAAAVIHGPIRLIGHSAGGHLVARMIMKDVALPVIARVQKVVPISPVSDLRPLLETSLNKALHLDAAEAGVESPALGQAGLDIPVSVWVGAEERPAFLDQARWLADAWHMPQRIAAGRHHFDILDDLRAADSPLVNDILGDSSV